MFFDIATLQTTAAINMASHVLILIRAGIYMHLKFFIILSIWACLTPIFVPTRVGSPVEALAHQRALRKFNTNPINETCRDESGGSVHQCRDYSAVWNLTDPLPPAENS